jgi:hypothetical protein
MKNFFLLLIVFFFNFTACDNKRATLGNFKGVPFPVISSLFNSRMLLLLKLTYATDSPLEFSEINGGTGKIYQDKFGVGTGLDITPDLFGLPDAKDLNFFIDVGEIRISSKYTAQVTAFGVIALNDIRATKRFWDRIAPVRQVYCTTLYTFGGNSCINTSKAFPLTAAQLFNGEGVKYPSNDPTAEEYYDQRLDFRPANDTEPINQNTANRFSRYFYTGVFVRNFITGWARENNANITTSRFDNNPILTGGTNLIPRNNFIAGTPDADKSSRNAPLMFPVFYAAGDGHQDMDIRPGSDPYILEVRMNIKEILMVHSFTTLNGTVQTMVNVSDWRKPHSSEQDMGGNILTRSRVIYPETASSLQITGGTRSLTHYYTLYRKEETNFTDQLPLAATPVKDGISKIKYINPGNYRLRCVGDLAPNVDGHPETLIRETTFSVNTASRQTISINLACP